MKIKSLKLINFRLFEEELFEFTPLTILTGPNSSGKSTLVKALTLLQENLKSPNYLGRLTFKEGNHRLGSFESVLKTGAKQKTIGFDLKIENTPIKRLGQDDRHVFDDVKYFNISLRYAQDSIQKENGLISEYRVDLEYAEGSPIKIIHLTRKADVASVFVNIKWLGESLLEKRLFKISPNFYKVWGKLNPEDIKSAINEIIISRKKEKDIKLEVLENESEDSSSGQSLDNSKHKFIQNQLDQLEKDSVENRKLFEEETKRINQSIEELEQKDLEQRKKSQKDIYMPLIRDQIKALNSDLEKVESSFNDRQEEIDRHKENLLSEQDKRAEDEIDESIRKKEGQYKKELEDVGKSYEETLEEINEGYIRNELNEQIRYSAIAFFEDLVQDNQLQYDTSPLRGKTLLDYLINEEWKGDVESLVNKYHSLEAVEAILWNSETDFIKEKLLSEGSVFFMDIFINGDEEGDYNQLTNNLITQLRIVIKELFQPLPFYALSAVRGLQQRFYQSSSSSSFDLEVSLSNLLSMQYQREKEKLDFINHWVREFEIGQQVFAEVIEGDFIKGCIQDLEENGGQLVNLADKGLGISQLLPIIVAAADALESGMLICVEEPGTHLHPKLQSKLVDLVASGILKNISFLFETHSEYFIRKLQWMLSRSDQGISSKDIQIKYLGEVKNINDNIISINCEGELVNKEGLLIETFGGGFLDEATKWVNKREAEKEFKEILSNTNLRDQINRGKSIVLCENKNADHLNSIGVSNMVFYPAQNKDAIYIRVKSHEGFQGLVDRDYLSDFEIEKVEQSIPRLKILRYYCFENYLYHPDNIKELMPAFFEEYLDLIRKEKENKRKDILRKVDNDRKSYEFLKNSSGIFKNNDFKDGSVEMFEYLESDDFETFYKVFDMKKYCGSIKQKVNLRPSELSSTNWFKSKFVNLLNSINCHAT